MNELELISKKKEFLFIGNLDFTVGKQQMYIEASNLKDHDKTPFYATVRQDSGAVLGCVTDRYVVKQNHELLDIILDKIGHEQYDLSKSKCGQFKGGKKVFFFIKIENQVDFGQEYADTFVYAVSSHDGSARLAFGITTQIHSCSNMFGLLMADKENQHIIKHTKRMEGLVEHNKLDELIKKNIEGVSRVMIALQSASPGEVFVKNILDLVGKIDGKRVLEETKRKRNELMDSIVSEMQDKGDTYYGMFNGVTHYLTHKTKENGSDDWFDYNLNGKGSQIISDALKLMTNDMKANKTWEV